MKQQHNSTGIMSYLSSNWRQNTKRARIDGMLPWVSLSPFEEILSGEVWQDVLLPLLDPIDLIRLMHTSKTARRAAAPVLNRIETESISTAFHANMFRNFLRRPRVTTGNHVWDELKNPKADVKQIP